MIVGAGLLNGKGVFLSEQVKNIEGVPFIVEGFKRSKKAFRNIIRA